MEKIVKEAVEQALQSQQQQEIQELTEQVNKLEERVLNLNKLGFLTILAFGIVLLLSYAFIELYDRVDSHIRDFIDLKCSFIKLKRKKDNKSHKDDKSEKD